MSNKNWMSWCLCRARRWWGSALFPFGLSETGPWASIGFSGVYKLNRKVQWHRFNQPPGVWAKLGNICLPNQLDPILGGDLFFFLPASQSNNLCDKSLYYDNTKGKAGLFVEAQFFAMDSQINQWQIWILPFLLLTIKHLEGPSETKLWVNLS